MCKIQNFFGHLALCLTSFILITISVERYLAIVKHSKVNNKKISKPFCKILKCFIFSQKFKLKGALLLLIIFWIVSSAIVIPYFIYNLNLPVVEGVNCYWLTENYMCVNIWPIGITGNIYKSSYWFGMFILPGIILLFSYGSISRSLFLRKNLNISNNGNTGWRSKSKRHIIIILICESLFYAICWFPISIWSMHLSLNSLAKQAIKSTFEKDIILFNKLYSIALLNVSLKWVFRLIASWPRLRDKFNFTRNLCSKNKIAPLRRATVNEPYMIAI